MRLRVLNSGSKANGYVLYNDQEALVLECGVPYSKCLQAVGFKRKNIVGALVTHEHGDHAKYVEQYLGAAIKVYASQGTIDSLRYKYRMRPTLIRKNELTDIGGFKVLAFDTQHDCAEPYGFLIHHEECGNVLFVTDSYYLKYRFAGLNQVMIECNYCNDIINKNVEDGIVPRIVRDRVFKSHMSLDTTLEMLSANDLTNVHNVVLLHLSGDNSDSDLFRTTIEKGTGKIVTVARKDVDISFDIGL